MKKTQLLSILVLATILLTACEDKWQGDISHLDQGWIDYQYQRIEESQAKLLENPQDDEALFTIAYRYEELENYREAVRYYEKVLEINPDYFVVYNNLATIYERVEDYEEASKNIEIYFQYNQGNSEAAKDAVRILLENNDPENAQIALDAFVTQTKGNTSEEYLEFISDLKDQIYNYEVEHGLK